MTGDIHPKSDLDLLILINDDGGWQLGSTFILEDEMFGNRRVFKAFTWHIIPSFVPNETEALFSYIYSD